MANCVSGISMVQVTSIVKPSIVGSTAKKKKFVSLGTDKWTFYVCQNGFINPTEAISSA